MRKQVALIGAALCALVPALATGDAAVTISEEGRRSQAPEVAIGPDGSVHVIWLDKGESGTADRRGNYSGGGHSHQSFTDLYYARSNDGGMKFSDPVQVNAQSGEIWGFSISKPEIAVSSDGTIHVFYPANAKSSTTGLDVANSVYLRSTDGGKTFGDAMTLNSDPDEDLSAIVSGGLAQAQVFGSMAVSAGGDVHTFWLDTREMKADDKLSSVYRRSSADAGDSWGEETRLFNADTCPCCQVTSTVAEGGDVYVSARTVSPDNVRTPTVSVSRDGGDTFSERSAVAGPPWQLDGCPLKPTALATDGDHLYTLVHNGATEPPGLLFSRSLDGGRSFEDALPIHPGAAVSDFPVLVATDGQLHAVWHAKVDGPRRVYYRISDDGGASFGPVQELPAPAGAAAYPSAAAGDDGSLVIVWQQDEQILAMRADGNGG